MNKKKEKQTLNFINTLDDFLSKLFSKGVYQPTDICICLLLMIESQNKQELKHMTHIDPILEKLSISVDEFQESISRLELKGILKASHYM